MVLAMPSFARDAADTGATKPGEIVVTATKRDETLRDVALPISAVTGEDLAAANANSLSDYITRLPGVTFNDYQPGISEVVIRGIAATTYHEQGQTTTGYYMNEIPLVEPGWPIGIPDVDTFDLDRVEVLRGPQGTLFGSSSLGGAVNYVVKTADTSAFDAAGEALIGYTDNAQEANYAAKAMVNVPIIQDVLAVRGMALQRYDAGYIDNLATGDEGSNNFRTRGLRGSIVLTPSVDTKVTWMTAYQDTRLDDQTYITSLDALTRSGIARNEPQETSFFLNSLKLEQDLGFADFTAFGSIDKKTNTTVLSYPTYGYLNGVYEGEDAPYSLGTADSNLKQVEARLASKDEGPVTWLIGTSYLHAKKASYDQIIAPGAEDIYGSTLAPADVVYGYRSNSVNEDFGLFGEVTLTPVNGVELTLGGRYYSNKYSGTVINEPGAISGSTTGSSATVSNSEDGFTPKVTLALHPSDDFMWYATYSKGYRVGGINPNAGFLDSLPQTYGSDEVDNYEMGVKFSALEDRIYIETSVFNLDWKNIQARLFGPAPTYYSYVVNAGGANVAGVEFSGTVNLSKAISFSSNVTYQDAKLTALLPDSFAAGGGYASGTTLPGSSKWSVANNLRLTIPGSAMAPTFEVAHRYLSSAPVAFGSTATRGDYNLFDLRASLTLGDHVKAMVFANNVFNERGVLNAPFTSMTAPAYSVTRPRTIGLRLDFGL
ncbi:TonB-dependent receptor [Novosphingobium profundi]|nr:TonB-dependent receptor [Novosphingobium profundi]